MGVNRISYNSVIYPRRQHITKNCHNFPFIILDFRYFLIFNSIFNFDNENSERPIEYGGLKIRKIADPYIFRIFKARFFNDFLLFQEQHRNE